MQTHSITTFASAQRVHTALTANPEKRLLLWLARHTPGYINSDHLTLLALVAQVAAGVSYAEAAHAASYLWLVNLFLIFNWLGDSLDGTLARVRKKQRPRYGFYVDHMVDTVGALALMTGLGCSGYIHWQIVICLLVGFYVLAIESYLATYAVGRFHISHGLFGPTEIRLLLIAGNIAILAHKYIDLASYRFLLFDIGGSIAVAGMAVMAVIAVARHTQFLYREEPLP